MKNKILGEEATKLMIDAASPDYHKAQASLHELAKAFEVPVQEAVLNGYILDNIFDVQPVPKGKTLEYSIDLVTQGNVKNHKAFVLPDTGSIPERHVESDYIKVNTFQIGNSIDCRARLLEVGSFDIMKRMVEILAAGFVDKINDDGWRLIIKALYDRGLKVNDSAAAQGFFTKKLIRAMKTTLLRYGGGNSASNKLRVLTDVFMSLESLDDMATWDLTQVDDATRREIFMSEDGTVAKIFGVKLHGLFEFGVGQTYQKYYENTLGGTMTSGKEEIVVALSLKNKDSLVMADESPVEIFEDPTYHRQRRVSLYGWKRHGFACLDNRVGLIGEI